MQTWEISGWPSRPYLTTWPDSAVAFTCFYSAKCIPNLSAHHGACERTLLDEAKFKGTVEPPWNLGGTCLWWASCLNWTRHPTGVQWPIPGLVWQGVGCLKWGGWLVGERTLGRFHADKLGSWDFPSPRRPDHIWKTLGYGVRGELILWCNRVEGI